MIQNSYSFSTLAVVGKMSAQMKTTRNINLMRPKRFFRIYIHHGMLKNKYCGLPFIRGFRGQVNHEFKCSTTYKFSVCFSMHRLAKPRNQIVLKNHIMNLKETFTERVLFYVF